MAPITVVLGNPPYKQPFDEQQRLDSDLLQPYKSLNGKPLGRRVCLNDDYLKFIRLEEHRIETTGFGILSYICPGYIDGITFNGLATTSSTPLTRSRYSTCTTTPTAENGIPASQSRNSILLPSSRAWPSCCVSGTPRLTARKHLVWGRTAEPELQQLQQANLQSLRDRPLTVEITQTTTAFDHFEHAPEVITEYAKGFSVAEL